MFPKITCSAARPCVMAPKVGNRLQWSDWRVLRGVLSIGLIQWNPTNKLEAILQGSFFGKCLKEQGRGKGMNSEYLCSRHQNPLHRMTNH